ncbi:PREDICTED: uncharacterized mitochondrial protein AtMg00810-like [Prunus mume]|uniref:Uncharacterized mitochondrial protein AtMg00810-like n=1 Tax=Prunus mume TaxID=102107 RepID=A0ABM1LLK8_PRUMU|nr:PREDICTED: uncharacterized mitochondrial protein AtMg00810-like [Prunus mume]
MGIVVLLVYVDDIVIIGSDLEAIFAVQTLLHSTFHMKDLGQLTYFLGLEIHHQPHGLFLHQHKYNQDLVQLTPSWNLIKFMQAPRHHHLSAVRRIIRYILGTPSRGLFFPTGFSLQLQAYSDADWAGCPNTRRSTTGWCMFLGDALISWKYKKQNHVSKSSTEVEYRAMSAACSEIIWLRALLTELGFNPLHPTPLHADNTSAIQIAANPVYHERTKHIEVDSHSIREAYDHHVITFPHASTTLQIADIFTNPCHASAIISSLAN